MSVRSVYDARAGQFGHAEGIFDPTSRRGGRFQDALLAGSREEAHELHRAIWDHEFSVNYQPVIEVASGRLVGAEALLRWRHDGELLPAERFLRFAERTGLVLRLGSRVLREVASFHARVGLQAPDGLPISVNLSLTELLHPFIQEMILDALDASDCAPNAIEAEVSEKDLADDPPAVTAAIERLAASGIGCILDDLGASTLAGGSVESLPLVAAKIDLPAALRTEEALYGQGRLIEQTQALGIPVIAKRVATPEHLELLSWLRIQRAQGHAFGEPVPADVFRGLLQDAGLLGDPGPRPLLPARRRTLVPQPAANGSALRGEIPQPRSAAP